MARAAVKAEEVFQAAREADLNLQYIAAALRLLESDLVAVMADGSAEYYLEKVEQAAAILYGINRAVQQEQQRAEKLADRLDLAAMA